ncbi:MAG TPA: hypothetical protein H9837_06210 [Candidatus Brachybacterium merdigallinarum]|nr:hypothetical protein [Candidatus Brachybacterium merdigallinarum]
MASKKSGSGGRDSRRSVNPARAARERERLLADLQEWEGRRRGEENSLEHAQTLDTLLRLKDDELDSPEIGLWTGELLTELLTHIAPRKIVQRREQSMGMVPAVHILFDYLQAHQLWHRRSDPLRDMRELLAVLEFEVLEAADDPTRRSFSTNILNYGMDHGLDPTDEDALAAYMSWYNSLPDAERVEVSDTGRLVDPSVPYDPASAQAQTGLSAFGTPLGGAVEGTGPHSSARLLEENDGLGDGEEFSDDEVAREGAGAGAPGTEGGFSTALVDPPWFLPLTELTLDHLLTMTEAELGDELARMPLTQRALALMDLVGEGIAVTDSGALKRVHTQEMIRHLGIPERTVRSMWDVPELEETWSVLLRGGWIEIQGTRARPADGLAEATAPGRDREGFVLFARALLLVRLLPLVVEDEELDDPDDAGDPVGDPDVVLALLYAGQPGGLTLPAFHDVVSALEGRRDPAEPLGPHLGEIDHEDYFRYVTVRQGLGELEMAGILEREGETFSAPAPVVLTLLSMMQPGE